MVLMMTSTRSYLARAGKLDTSMLPALRWLRQFQVRLTYLGSFQWSTWSIRPSFTTRWCRSQLSILISNWSGTPFLSLQFSCGALFSFSGLSPLLEPRQLWAGSLLWQGSPNSWLGISFTPWVKLQSHTLPSLRPTVVIRDLLVRNSLSPLKPLCSSSALPFNSLPCTRSQIGTLKITPQKMKRPFKKYPSLVIPRLQ